VNEDTGCTESLCDHSVVSVVTQCGVQCGHSVVSVGCSVVTPWSVWGAVSHSGGAVWSLRGQCVVF